MFAPMDPLDVLDVVAENGLRLERTTGRLYLGPPPVPPLLKELVTVHRDLVSAVLVGRRTGHVWGRCDLCRQGRMIRAGSSAPCAMTPGCAGHHAEAAR